MLIISAFMMFAGVFVFLTRKSTLAILLSVELMLNATDLNFAVFNRMLYPDGYEGYFFALFSIAISAAESAIAIAIMINIYRMLKNIQVDELEKMKKEALEDAVNTAMTLFLVIPMEVLMDYYWPKSYAKRIPEFADRVLDYYYRWQIGELDMEKMEKDLETYAGIKFVEEKLDG